MPGGKLLACESRDSRGIIGSHGAVTFSEDGAVGGEAAEEVLCSSVRKVTKVGTPINAGRAGTFPVTPFPLTPGTE